MSQKAEKKDKISTIFTPPPPHTHRHRRLILLFSPLHLFFICLFFVNCQCGVETSTDTPNTPPPCDEKDPNSDCDKDGVKNSLDVDKDNDGLIELHTLAQFHALRNDLDGDGISDEGVVVDNNLRGAVGCPDGGCQGYELADDLSFDENGDGEQNDTYNQDDGTWEWEFFTNATDTFVGSFEDTDSTFPLAVWQFSRCNNGDGNIVHDVPSSEHFNRCNGLFQGEVVEELTSGGQNASKMTIHRSSLPLSYFFSPESISWTVKFKHLEVIIFEHTYSPHLSFLLPADGEGEDCTDVTNQTGGKANSSYSIRTAHCGTNTYNANLFRGKFEYNDYSITWE